MATGHETIAFHGPWWQNPALLENPKNWVAAGFVIFMLLAIRYIVPKVNAGLDARAAKINEQLQQAEKLRAEAEALLAQYKKQQKEMKKQAEELVANAEKEAEAIKAKAAEELKASLARRRAQAEEGIKRAQDEATREMRLQLVNIASAATRSVISDKLKDAKNDPAISRALSAIEQHIH